MDSLYKGNVSKRKRNFQQRTPLAQSEIKSGSVNSSGSRNIFDEDYFHGISNKIESY